jgi:hypothetical protein
MTVFALLVGLLCDAAIVGSGAWLLWVNSADSVFAGSLAGTLLAFGACGGLIVLRQLVLARLTSGREGMRLRVETLLVASEMVVLAALVTAWLATGLYLLGWFACFAAALCLLAAALQLMIDVLIGPHRMQPLTRRRASLAARRMFSVEVLRLFAGLCGLLGLLVTAPVHGWQPEVLNPLIFSLGATVVAAAGLSQAFLTSFGRGAVAHKLSSESAR